MTDLELSFSQGRIFGRGTDIVGDFDMDGELTNEWIFIRKQYVGQHSIDYHGQSVGEGAYGGTWSCYGTPGGKWFIGIVRAEEISDESTSQISEL
ncbi:MAG: hypothetical protein AAF802_29735 [Planctomycetota bacterium]